MLRIAVIDDDKTLLCDMHKLFDRFIIAYDFDFTVEYFSSCDWVSGNERYRIWAAAAETNEKLWYANCFYFYDSGLCHGIIQDSTDCFLDQANCLWGLMQMFAGLYVGLQ